MIYVFAIAVPFALNFLMLPFLIHVAHKYSWYDHVNHRKVHSGEMPRIGGVGIFIATLLSGAGLIIIFDHGPGSIMEQLRLYLPLFFSVLFIHVVGLLDDFANLRARYKLWLQVAIALFIVVIGRHFEAFRLPFSETIVDLSFFGPVLTFLWIIGITNAINLIDGIDGLSGGVSSLAFFFIGLSALALGNEVGALVAFLGFGSTLAFLFFNFPPAKIFMGDSGSLFLGIMASLLPFYAFPAEETEGMVLALTVTPFIIPILDTISAILRRIRKRMAFYIPDQEHIHHKLLDRGYSTRVILIIMYGITLLASLSAYWYVVSNSYAAMAVMLVVWAATAGWFITLHYRRQSKIAE